MALQATGPTPQGATNKRTEPSRQSPVSTDTSVKMDQDAPAKSESNTNSGGVVNNTQPLTVSHASSNSGQQICAFHRSLAATQERCSCSLFALPDHGKACLCQCCVAAAACSVSLCLYRRRRPNSCWPLRSTTLRRGACARSGRRTSRRRCGWRTDCTCNEVMAPASAAHASFGQAFSALTAIMLWLIWPGLGEQYL